jgi:Bifunctional DNA primase/polymerase, N-terminal
MGWAILPTQGKDPHFRILRAVYGTDRWSHLREPASPDEIREWYAREPDAGVGIITGNGLAVADLDDRPRIRLHETPMVRTPNGWLHVYASTTEATPSRKLRDAADKKWGELQGEGCYVVAPPTPGYEWAIAPDGLGNCFLPEASLADLSQLDLSWLGNDEILSSAAALSSSAQASDHGLFAWDCREDFARAVAHLVGLSFGGRFCAVGRTSDSQRSACFWKDRRGRWIYIDFGAKPPRTLRSLTLAELYAAHVSGRIRRLLDLEHVCWQARLLIATGFASPKPIAFVPLATGLDQFTRRVYEGAVGLEQARSLTELHGQPFTFSLRFAACWIGEPPEWQRVGRAITTLRRKGLLVKVGERPGRGRATPLFVLGDGHVRDLDQGARV